MSNAPAVFRRLLRLCRGFDRETRWILGLVGRPPRQYDWHFKRAIRTRFQGSPFAEEMVWEASGFSTQFAMPQSNGVVARACRRHFRRTMALGLPYQSEALQLLRRFEDAKRLVQGLGAFDAASASAEGAMRWLKSFESGGHQQVQRGDLLIAHPMSCIKDANFDQAVVIIDYVSSGAMEDEVRGLVVNNPLRNCSTLQQLLSKAQTPEDKEWAESLVDHPATAKLAVFRGGPVILGNSMLRNLHWLHCFSTITGAREVAPGLWMGGDVIQILNRVAHNQVDGPLVRLCFGHAAWDHLQLRLELEGGVWTRARALEKEATDGLSVTASICLDDVPNAWRKTLLYAGQVEMANFPRNSKVDAKLRLHISQQESRNKVKTDDAKDGTA